MILNIVIMALVTLQRGGELLLSRRNTRRLIARGAVEAGAGHYPLIIAVHSLWLVSLWSLGLGRPVEPLWLTIFFILQLARVWVLVTLGDRWTTRIIVLPDIPRVRRGPYRFVDHPNYWIVVGEIAALPLAFGLWPIALVFSILNAAVLAIRIRSENAALSASAPK